MISLLLLFLPYAAPGEQEEQGSVPALVKNLHSVHDDTERAAADRLIAIAATDSDEVVQALTDVLAEEKPKSKKLHEWAAYALGNIELGSDTTIYRLLALVNKGVNATKEVDADAPANAAWAIGQIGNVPDQSVALKTLVRALNGGYSHLQEQAAVALGALAPGFDVPYPEMAVDALKEALKPVGADPRVRRFAAEALRRFGATGRGAIPELIQAAVNTADGPQQIRNATLKSLTDIVESLRYSPDQSVIGTLTVGRRQLATTFLNRRSFLAQKALSAISETIGSIESRSLRYLLTTHWIVALLLGAIVIYGLWSVALRVLILRKWPLSVLKLYDSLPLIDIPIPRTEIKIPLRGAVMAGCQYHARVLDAWVAKCVAGAREKVDHLRARDHSHYVSLPVEIGGRLVSDLSAKRLHSHCARSTWSIAIVGEGGLGKTTLAYEFARWALENTEQQRLSECHPMVPVIIELDSASEGSKFEDIEDEIRDQLKNMCDEERAPSRGLCEALLRTRRLLLILDNVCERFQEEFDHKFRDNINALIVTSRVEGKLTRHPALPIRPRYIEHRALFRLVDHYLETYGQELTMNQISGLAEKLQATVGESRRCTPLLANIFAQHLINLASGESESEHAANIPDLFIEYVRFLNRERGPGDPTDSTVCAAAKIAAWKCLERAYIPGAASKTDAEAELLASSMDTNLLTYLEKLGIIHDLKASDRYGFSMDTVAEYLAADHFAGKTLKQEDWRDFMRTASRMPGSPKRIREFLVAVCDCVQSKSGEMRMPMWLVPELQEMIQAGSVEESTAPAEERSAQTTRGRTRLNTPAREASLEVDTCGATHY